jgi:hypothetical protein
MASLHHSYHSSHKLQVLYFGNNMSIPRVAFHVSHAHRLTGLFNPHKQTVQRLPLQPTEEDFKRWYFYNQYSLPAAYISDAASRLGLALTNTITARLTNKEWRTETFDMSPVDIGPGSLLLPAIPLDLVIRSFRNTKDQHGVMIEDMKTLTQLCGLKTLQFSYG